jgi:hypothetical protein
VHYLNSFLYNAMHFQALLDTLIKGADVKKYKNNLEFGFLVSAIKV